MFNVLFVSKTVKADSRINKLSILLSLDKQLY